LYPLLDEEKGDYYKLLSFYLPEDRVGNPGFDSRGGTMDLWEKLMFRDNFNDVTLDKLLKLHLELLSYKKNIEFFIIPENLRLKEIDNPLKILDFVAEIETKSAKQSFLNLKHSRQENESFA
jgi:hypothetical protein